MSRRSRVPAIVIAAAWAVGGAALALVVAALVLGGTDAGHLVKPLLVAIAATVLAIAAAGRWLGDASLRLRFVSISAIAILLGLVNLAVLAALMLVSEKDAALVAVLLIYATAVAIGSGLAAGRASADAIERIAEAAERMAGGDLTARAGRVGGGRELEHLGATFDQMAGRLGEAQRRERTIEAQRRDLIVAVSHDLRTPLADLQAMAEAITDRVVSDPATVRHYADRMGASVSRWGGWSTTSSSSSNSTRVRSRLRVSGPGSSRWSAGRSPPATARRRSRGFVCAPSSATPPAPSARRG